MRIIIAAVLNWIVRILSFSRLTRPVAKSHPIRSIKAWASENTKGQAVHIDDGKQHRFVAILHVVIYQDHEDTKLWIAQSLDVDYVASGRSLEEAKHNFATGLSRMIKRHLEKFGDVSRIMQNPSKDICSEAMAKDNCQAFGLITQQTLPIQEIPELKDIPQLKQHLPFREIAFQMKDALA